MLAYASSTAAQTLPSSIVLPGLLEDHQDDIDFLFEDIDESTEKEIETTLIPLMNENTMNTTNEYNERDVLLGRGGGVNKHSGNRVYRRLIEHQKPLYKILNTKEEKTILIRSILQAFKNQGGRFLKKNGATWYQVSDADALSKISQAFRESVKSSPINCKKIVQQPQAPLPRHHHHMMIASTTDNTPNETLPTPAAPVPLCAGISQLFEPSSSNNNNGPAAVADAVEVLPMELSATQTSTPFVDFHKKPAPTTTTAAPACHAAPPSPTPTAATAAQRHDMYNFDVAAFMKSIAPSTMPEEDDDEAEGGLLGNTSSHHQQQQASASYNNSSNSQQQHHAEQFLRYMKSAAAAGLLDPSLKAQASTTAIAAEQQQQQPQTSLVLPEPDQREFVRIMRDMSMAVVPTTTAAAAAVSSTTFSDISVLGEDEPLPLSEVARQKSIDVMQLLRYFTGIVAPEENAAAADEQKDAISKSATSI